VPREATVAPERRTREVERMLSALRREIEAHRSSQLAIQRRLGWGRTYISQLFRQQKELRFNQILGILDGLGVDYSDFFFRHFHERLRLSRSDNVFVLGARLHTLVDQLPRPTGEPAGGQLHTLISLLCELILGME